MTENGWPQCGADQLDRSPIPGISLVIPLQRGIPSKILKAYAADYHLFVESLYNSRGGTDEGGWTPTNSVATSNHLSGSAMDLNWNDHPFRTKGTFSADQMRTLREILAFYEDTVFWAGDWDDPVDEMHHQMGYNTATNAGKVKCQNFIERKIRSDGFSFFRKGSDEPQIVRKPVVPSSGGSNWADVSQYQGVPVDDHYPHSIISFRTNSGDKVDTLALQNAKAALKGLKANKASIVIPYYFFRPGQDNCDLHRKILDEAGLWLHPHTVSMVDVESDQGSITGDQSWEVNDEINRLRGWYGNTRRVIGYWNPNADATIWLQRPYALELVIPQYNNRPGDLSGVRDEIARREAFAHQYTDKAQNIPPWSGQNVDMNWTPYTIAELAVLFGMEEQIKAPDAGGPLDLTKVDIEEMCAAIGAQFGV